MPTITTTEPATVAPGQIQFLDSIQPPLTAGAYTLQAVQTVGAGLPPGQSAKYEIPNQAFEVVGPRFQIPASTISSVFPPKDLPGSYADVLPHIVFKDFALPWARNIDPQGGTDQAGSPPWIGLLTIYDDETGNVSEPATVPLSQLVTPGGTTVGPVLGNTVDVSSDATVSVVDIDYTYFQAIAPQLKELPFLAHGRCVNTDGKVLMGMNADGCFSVVIGNRVAKFDSTKPHKNLILMVSLEGHQGHLNGGTAPSAGQKIRLVLLGQWSFTANPLPGSFIGLMQALCNPGNGGVKLLSLPVPQDPVPDPVVKEALQIGFVPLENKLRVGEETTSWYRGPLSPSLTFRDQTYGPYHFSDHAIHYDPATGLFNMSYACAWQIGRLLALSDAVFAQALFDWRRDYFASLKSLENQADVLAPLNRSLLRGAAPSDNATGTLPARLSDHLYQFLASSLVDVVPRFATPVERASRAGFKGCVSPERAQEIVASGQDPLQAIQ